MSPRWRVRDSFIKFSLIGLDALREPFVRRALRRQWLQADRDLAGVIRKFAQVARPVVFEQPSADRVVDGGSFAAQATGYPVEEAGEQQRHILVPFAKRWCPQSDDVQAIVEILA